MDDPLLTPPHPTYPPTLGALLQPDGRCSFRVWAPKPETVELHLVNSEERLVPMQPEGRGYWSVELDGIAAGARYFFRLNGQDSWPDPASRFQPDGVHKPSAVAPRDFAWTDAGWHGLPLKDYITYELHVGTFSPEGTFDGVIPYLDGLAELGITAIELLPIAQFPGARNWGYDGVHPFAAQNTYGGPEGLKRLVDACHARGMAVELDVVYNHMGPEGNYTGQFGHYFTSKYHTPWGDALNFDSAHSDEVRRFFIESALHWIGECHVDALRLDAVHAIYDFSAYPFLQELGDAAHTEGRRLNRQVHLIAESSLEDEKLCREQAAGGWGLDSQWSDGLHHALRTALTGERPGYYADYNGFPDIVRALRDGFVYEGQYSRFRRRRHGNVGHRLPPERFVVFSQNHDQVGNRMFGERLNELVSFEQQKLAAGVTLLSPYLPMLFMGEEYAETAPFQFFVSYLDPGLNEAVRQGRKDEFKSFDWQHEPPDPASEETFNRCKLNHDLKDSGRHRLVYEFYKELIRIRRTDPALAFAERDRMDVAECGPGDLVRVHLWTPRHDYAVVYSFDDQPRSIDPRLPRGDWLLRLDSADTRWDGPRDKSLSEALPFGDGNLVSLPPHSFLVLTRQRPSDWPDWS